MSRHRQKKNLPKSPVGVAGRENEEIYKPGKDSGIFFYKIVSILNKIEVPLIWLCLTGIITLSFLLSFHTLIDTDIFWHLKTGQIIYETHQIPDKDIYSFTRAGKEWIDSQWLFQLLIYIFYRFSGYTGMILFGSVITALTWLLILVPGFNSRKYFSLLLFGLISLLVVSIRLKLRPEILSFFYLASEILLIDLLKRGKKFAIFALPILLLLWVNSEGLWPIYFVVLCAFLLEEILFIPDSWLKRNFPGESDSKKSATELGIALICSIPLAFANPYFYRGVLFPWTLFKEVAHPGSYLGKIINEFQNPFTNLPWFDLSVYICLILMSALFFVALLIKRRVYPASLLLWLCFLVLSFSALRNGALFAIITVSLLARIFAENKERIIFPFPELLQKFSKLGPVSAILLLGFMVWLMTDVISSRFYLRNHTFARFGIGALETEYPIRAARTLELISANLGKPLELKIFPDAETSAYLIWRGYPDWKVYVDPRLEVYGEEFFENYMEALTNWQAFQKEDEKWDFDVVVLSYYLSMKDIVLSLYNAPNWSLVYIDGYCAVFIKNKPEFLSVIEKYKIDFSKDFSSPLPGDVDGLWMARERLNRGKLLLMMNQPQWAVIEFQEGIKFVPEDLDFNYYLGTTLNLLLRYEEALPYLEFVAKKQPDFARNQIQLARALASTGEYDRAIKIFQGLLNSFPNHIYVCIDLAKVYEMVQQEDMAYAQWRRCEEISRLDPLGFKPQIDEISEALKRYKQSR